MTFMWVEKGTSASEDYSRLGGEQSGGDCLRAVLVTDVESSSTRGDGALR